MGSVRRRNPRSCAIHGLFTLATLYSTRQTHAFGPAPRLRWVLRATAGRNPFRDRPIPVLTLSGPGYMIRPMKKGVATFDVVVAGLGAMGSAAVYHLAKFGRRVAGFDRFHPPHTRGSSHGHARVIREAYASGPEYVESDQTRIRAVGDARRRERRGTGQDVRPPLHAAAGRGRTTRCPGKRASVRYPRGAGLGG